MSWKDMVQDPDETKVFSALDGPMETWRTVSAIARQTGLPAGRVLDIFKKYDLKLTRLAEMPSITGQPLVGLIEKVG